METGHDHQAAENGCGSFWTSRAFVVFGVFAAMALILLWREHKAHILGAIPYLFLLLCPLMHIFMHGGHGHRGDSGNTRDHNEAKTPKV